METPNGRKMHARFVLVLFALLTVSSPPAFPQHTVGRWALSLHADANAWFTDYNQRIVGLGADVQVRYGVSRLVSLGGEFSLERLKTGQNRASAGIPTAYLSLNGRSLSSLVWCHLSPGKPVAPYLFAGIGVLWYSRKSETTYFPDERVRSSYRVPLGIGIESFSLKGLSFDFSLAYNFLDDNTDAVRTKFVDGAINVKFGMSLYLGSSDDDDEDGDGVRNGEEEQLGTNPTNPDTDEDGLLDGVEVRRRKTDPLNPDSDGDTLKDGEEVTRYKTDPLMKDTDADGINDGDEVNAGTDPLDPERHP